MSFSRISPRATRRIWTPPNDDHRFKTSWFQPSNDTMKEQEELLANMFFLVRQGSEFGERLRCTNCNGRHDYITLMCVYKPISGLANGLYAYYRAVKDAGISHTLKADAKERYDQIENLLSTIPDLSTIHPQLARKMVQDVGVSDLQLGAVSLGILEGISPTDAQRLVDKINEKGLRPPYALNKVPASDVTRALEYNGPKFSRSRW